MQANMVKNFQICCSIIDELRKNKDHQIMMIDLMLIMCDIGYR